MKIVRLICFLFASLTGVVRSAVIAHDDFSYANGGLVGQNGGTGWGGAYTNDGADFTVTSQAINASNSAGLAGQVKRVLSTTINLTNFPSGEIWLGFDGSIELTGGFGYGGPSFFTGGSENGLIGAVLGRDMFGIGGNDNGATGSHRTIVKFDLNTNAVSLWSGIISIPFDVTAPPLQTGTMDIKGADTIRFAIHSGNMSMDNFTLATTPVEAGAIPEPTAMLLMLLGGSTLIGRRRGKGRSVSWTN